MNSNNFLSYVIERLHHKYVSLLFVQKGQVNRKTQLAIFIYRRKMKKENLN